MMGQARHVIVLMKLSVVLACLGMVIFWPEWRVSLLELTYPPEPMVPPGCSFTCTSSSSCDAVCFGPCDILIEENIIRRVTCEESTCGSFGECALEEPPTMPVTPIAPATGPPVIPTPPPVTPTPPPSEPPPPPEPPPPSTAEQDVQDSFEYSDDEEADCAESDTGASGFLAYFDCKLSRALRPPLWNPEQRRRGEYPEVNTQLQPIAGLTSYQPPDEQWGREETVDALSFIGLIWWGRHFFTVGDQWNAPRIQIGDLSYEGGGDTPQHRSHHEGLDVDIRIMRNDRRDKRCRIDEIPSCYDRPLTQELINLLLQQAESPGGTPVQYIITADEGLQGPPNIMRYDRVHKDHIHVRFRPRP